VHTVYQGAQHFRHDAAAEHGRLALEALREHAPGAHEFAHALGIAADEALYARVIEKLEREPVEDFRVDFEDGYGYPPDDEEDATALAVADEMARDGGRDAPRVHRPAAEGAQRGASPAQHPHARPLPHAAAGAHGRAAAGGLHRDRAQGHHPGAGRPSSPTCWRCWSRAWASRTARSASS
jgi:hypothetical protein